MPFSHTCWHNPTKYLLVVDKILRFCSQLLQVAYLYFRHAIVANSLMSADFSAVGPKFAWHWTNYPVIWQEYVGYFQLL